MKTGYEIFLMTAEEKNISRAAERAFVTQQCVSDHIKQLEKEYGVQLFERRPKFKLTPAGEVMLQNVRNIQILEKRMNSDLKDMAHGEVGKFTLGISTSRAPVILPAVLPHYHEAFPKVKISFCIEDTQVLEERLLRGDIDLFIGVNTDPNPEFCIQTIALDEIVLVISSELLHSYFRVEEIKMMQKGVDMERFCDVPFTLSFKTGKVNRVIQEYLNDRKLQLKVMYNISDSETQILLCAEGICASLCPKMLLTTAYRHNLTCSENKKLYMLPINHLDRKLHIDLVTHSHMSQPMYVRVFIETLRKEVAEISKRNFLAIGQD